MKRLFATVCARSGMLMLAFSGAWMACAQQTSEVKERPPVYIYSADWAIPRNKLDQMDERRAGDDKSLEAALASGKINGFGDDTTLIHTPNGYTHDRWFMATSMAGVLRMLDQLAKGKDKVPVLMAATKHADSLLVSEFYNWHSGSVKNGYFRGVFYTLKADAPSTEMNLMNKILLAPKLEKLLADGSISAYVIATEAIHTASPTNFMLYYLAAEPEGLDKVNTAIKTYDSMQMSSYLVHVDVPAHRDGLWRSSATFK